MSKPAAIRYRTLNRSACNASLRERGSLTVWFDPAMPWHSAPSGKRDVQLMYSDTAIQACLTIRIPFGLPLRQTTGFGASLLKLVDLDGPVPDCSTLCRRQKTSTVQVPCRGSTGITVRGEGQWHAHKHGGARRRVWRKIHLAVDESTLEVRSVGITGSGLGDAPVPPDLLGQIPAGEEIASVTADGACDTRGCRDAIAKPGANALAIVLEPMAHEARSLPGAMPSRGRRKDPGGPAGTRSCAPSGDWVGRSGAAGAVVIAAAASRPR